MGQKDSNSDKRGNNCVKIDLRDHFHAILRPGRYIFDISQKVLEFLANKGSFIGHRDRIDLALKRKRKNSFFNRIE